MTTAPTCEPLSARLPRISADTARLSRLAFDARFTPWLSALLRVPGVQITHETAPDGTAVLELQTGEGRVALGFDPGDWPALALALGLPAQHDPFGVAGLVLQPLLDHLASGFTAPRVAAAQLGASAAACLQIRLHTPQASVGLRHVDAAMADHISVLLARQPGPSRRLHALRVRGRLRLATRHWPWPLLRSLGAGDLVLLDGRESRQDPQLSFGVGTTMQASTELDLQTQRVTLRSEPRLTTEEADDHEAVAADSLDDLQLPVAFEIDTARIGLAELASMQAGMMIELDTPLLQASVRLVCHGQTVGQGQLVAIGEQLGVRITRMGLSSGAGA